MLRGASYVVGSSVHCPKYIWSCRKMHSAVLSIQAALRTEKEAIAEQGERCIQNPVTY